GGGRPPLVLLAAQPTRGVDIGAIEAIHKALLAARDRGCAILLISAELDELRTLCDRIAVLYRGQILADLPNDPPPPAAPQAPRRPRPARAPGRAARRRALRPRGQARQRSVK